MVKDYRELAASIKKLREDMGQQAEDVQFLKKNQRKNSWTRVPQTNLRGNFRECYTRCNKAGHALGNCVGRNHRICIGTFATGEAISRKIAYH